MDVAEWLRGLGLEQYAPAFRDNDIDGEVLSRLTGEDLRELGVRSMPGVSGRAHRASLPRAGDPKRSPVGALAIPREAPRTGYPYRRGIVTGVTNFRTSRNPIGGDLRLMQRQIGCCSGSRHVITCAEFDRRGIHTIKYRSEES